MARHRTPGQWLRPLALLSPILILYCTVYLGGLATVASMSFGLTGHAEHGGPTLMHYFAVLRSTDIAVAVERTLRVSLATVGICLLCGLPVARYIASSSGRWKAVVLMCVLSPVLVSSIGRIFGWISLFGPGSVVASLSAAMFGTKTTGLLYTEFAMVIGMSNMLLPFMVLSIATSRVHLDHHLTKAAAGLGARPLAVFWQVEFPLTLPGILSGMLTVFALSISNFVTAALLGGAGKDVVAYEIYLDILIYFQQDRGAALAMLLLVAVVILMTLAIRFSHRAGAGQPERGKALAG